jgi:hypothetical protein
MIGVLSWNYWHFGKQNIGVYAYYRLSTSMGAMLPLEKKLIYLGAFLGALSVSFLGLRAYQSLNSPGVHFDDWIYLSGHIAFLAKYLQYTLAFFTLVHIIRNRSRFDWKSATMFFLCVNYFLPAYLSLDDEQRWIAVYSTSFFSHGVQYAVFLFFHSCNAKEGVPAVKKRLRYVVIFLLMAATLALFTQIISPSVSIIDLSNISMISEAYMISLANALGVGVLLNHFWFDSYFWRFSDKESRNWLLDRFSFLFKPTSL